MKHLRPNNLETDELIYGRTTLDHFVSQFATVMIMTTSLQEPVTPCIRIGDLQVTVMPHDPACILYPLFTNLSFSETGRGRAEALALKTARRPCFDNLRGL